MARRHKSKAGKGKKERYCYLGDMARRSLWKYLAEREPHRDEPLFPTRGGRSGQKYWLHGLIARISKRAGVANAHPSGSRPFSRPEYVNKFKVLTDGILEAEESSRFLELVQRLPDLEADEIQLLNPEVSGNYLVENSLKGIF